MQARHIREMQDEWKTWAPLFQDDLTRMVSRMKATHNSMGVCGISEAEREKWMIERLCEIVHFVVREG